MTMDAALLARARSAGEQIRPLLGSIDAERRLPRAAVDALGAAGVFKLCVPAAYGGAQASPATLFAVIEELARVDGSLGWCVMIGATSGLMSVYLDDATAREVYGPDDAISCGVFAPLGRATPTADGYRVSGRWPFASGCEHSRWRMGGTFVATDPPELLPGGAPDVRSMLFHADQTKIVDTWDTTGLRGTGSHDITVEDAVVPRARSFSLISDRPRVAGYELPFFGVLASGIAAVGLGIARASIDTASELVRTKKAPGGKRPHSHRELVQVEVGRAEARVRASAALLREALGEAVDAAQTGEYMAPPVLAARARLRIAACHAATESAQVASAMYELGGGAAIYNASPLQRQFRDASVVTHHLMVSAAALTQASRVLLGVDTDVGTL